MPQGRSTTLTRGAALFSTRVVFTFQQECIKDVFFLLCSIPENIFQKMYRPFSRFLAVMQHSVMSAGVFLHTFNIFVCWLHRHEKL